MLRSNDTEWSPSCKWYYWLRARSNKIITYTDIVENRIFEFIKTELQNLINNGIKEYYYGPRLILLDSEKESLYTQIEQIRSFAWPDRLNGICKRISIDSSNYFLRNHCNSSRCVEKMVGTSLIISSLAGRDTFLYTFTKPIYIRNDTVRLIYARKIKCIYERSESSGSTKKKIISGESG